MPKVELIRVGLLQTDCYILYDENRSDSVVIDPGAEPELIRKRLNGRRIDAILLTHGHFDHIGGVNSLMEKDTQLMIHAADEELLGDPEKNAAWMVDDVITCCAPTRLLQEGDTVEAAGLRINVLHTPGHTRGGVCYECGSLLFTGDTMFQQGYGRYDLYGGELSALKRSLQRLMPLRDDHTILGGHG